jgi:hypothetical protein
LPATIIFENGGIIFSSLSFVTFLWLILQRHRYLGSMIDEQWIAKGVEGSSHWLMKVVSQNLSERTSREHEEPQSGQSQPGFN